MMVKPLLGLRQERRPERRMGRRWGLLYGPGLLAAGLGLFAGTPAAGPLEERMLQIAQSSDQASARAGEDSSWYRPWTWFDSGSASAPTLTIEQALQATHAAAQAAEQAAELSLAAAQQAEQAREVARQAVARTERAETLMQAARVAAAAAADQAEDAETAQDAVAHADAAAAAARMARQQINVLARAAARTAELADFAGRSAVASGRAANRAETAARGARLAADQGEEKAARLFETAELAEEAARDAADLAEDIAGDVRDFASQAAEAIEAASNGLIEIDERATVAVAVAAHLASLPNQNEPTAPAPEPKTTVAAVPDAEPASVLLVPSAADLARTAPATAPDSPKQPATGEIGTPEPAQEQAPREPAPETPAPVTEPEPAAVLDPDEAPVVLRDPSQEAVPPQGVPDPKESESTWYKPWAWFGSDARQEAPASAAVSASQEPPRAPRPEVRSAEAAPSGQPVEGARTETETELPSAFVAAGLEMPADGSGEPANAESGGSWYKPWSWFGSDQPAPTQPADAAANAAATQAAGADPQGAEAENQQTPPSEAAAQIAEDIAEDSSEDSGIAGPTLDAVPVSPVLVGNVTDQPALAAAAQGSADTLAQAESDVRTALAADGQRRAAIARPRQEPRDGEAEAGDSAGVAEDEPEENIAAGLEGVAHEAVLAAAEADAAAKLEGEAVGVAKEAALKAAAAAEEARRLKQEATKARRRSESARRLAEEASGEAREFAQSEFETLRQATAAAERQAREAEEIAEQAAEESEDAIEIANEARREAREMARLAARKEREAEAAQSAVLPSDDDPSIKLRVRFSEGEAVLTDRSQTELAGLAESLRESAASPVEILAYWSGVSEKSGKEKLYSLKRGMTVRSFLKDYGVPTTRIVLKEVNDADSAPSLIDIKVR